VTKVSSQPEEEKRTPLDDRVKNMEAILLAFLAQHNLPLSMSSSLIELCQEFGRDREALKRLSMDRTTASYKLKYGLSKTIEDALLHQLRKSPFSLNTDEAMNSNKQKVLGILVSTFSDTEGKTTINHLASVELVKVTSENLFQALDELFSSKQIPWENLTSILTLLVQRHERFKGRFRKTDT